MARFAALGIPAVNYGPGISEIAHTPAEYVEIPKIAECETRLRSWLSLSGLPRRLPGRAVAEPDRGGVLLAAEAHPADRHNLARVIHGRDAGQ